jgi:4a-hydroxytetrahydrobiopterin dehydratase
MNDNWHRSHGHLIAEFKFENFVNALKFVNEVGELAEAAQHHPDIELYSYKNVRVSLTTHDAGNKVTEKDFSMAKSIDIRFGKYAKE